MGFLAPLFQPFLDASADEKGAQDAPFVLRVEVFFVFVGGAKLAEDVLTCQVTHLGAAFWQFGQDEVCSFVGCFGGNEF